MHSKRLPFLLFILFFLAFIPWAVGLWPGVYTADSLNTLSQLKNHAYNNWHSYVFTGYVALLRMPIGLGGVIVTQIVLTSALGAAGFSYLLRHTKNKWVVIFFALLFALSPAVALMNVVVWKDVPYSIAVTAWMLSLWFFREQKKRLSNVTLLALSTLLAISASFRHNGITLLPCVPLAFIVAEITSVKRAILFAVIGTSMYWCIQIPVAAGFRVERDFPIGTRIQKFSMLAALLLDPDTDRTLLSKEEADAIEEMLPLETALRHYRCIDDKQWVHINPKLEKLIAHDDLYARVATGFNKLALQNPKAIVLDRLCYASTVLLSEGFVYANDLNRTEEFGGWLSWLGIKRERPSKLLASLTDKIISLTLEPITRSLIWNIWIPAVSLVLLTLIAIMRRDRALAACLLIVACNVPVFLFLALAPEWRYFYYLHLSMYFLLPYVLVTDSTRSSR